MGNSVEIVRPLPMRDARASEGLQRWQLVVLLLLLVWLYAAISARLFLQWVGPNHDPNFEHGIFVPLFSLFVIWQDRAKLKAIPSIPSWAGLPIIVFSLLTLGLGDLGAENFLSRVSLLILLAGLIVLFKGWPFFRAVLFPWAFLILMIPIPDIIIQQITFPLQLLAAKLATGMLELAGIPVFRQGNEIILAKMPLDVVQACSGLRSLLTLITLAIIYGYLLENRQWVRFVLAFCAIPIAVVANSFRIFVTGVLVQYWDPDKAEGFFHQFEGLLIFVVAMILLFIVHRLISIIWKPGPIAPGATKQELEPAGRPPISRDGFARFAVAALLLLATAGGLQARSSTEYHPPRASLSSLPAEVHGWVSRRDEVVDRETLKILGPHDYVLRDYENVGDPQPPINLYIAYFPVQRTGGTIHSPNHCLPGAGWIPVSRERVPLKGPDGASFSVNRYVVANGGDRQLVLYWFQAHGRTVASEWDAKYYLVSDALHMNRTDGALIRLMSPMLPNETREAAQERIMKLGSNFLPLLDQYIPR